MESDKAIWLEKRRWVGNASDDQRQVRDAALLTPADVPIDYLDRLGFPGEYPFTRGIYPGMYTDRPWVMRQIVGFGTAEETHDRFRFLLDHGETGLSMTFDMPTVLGMDSDDPMCSGEVGRSGIPIDSIDDMITVFKGLPIDKVHVALLCSYASAPALTAMYIAAAEEMGFDRQTLFGSTQNHLLAFYVALQKCCLVPPRAAIRIVNDTFEFTGREMPRWAPVNVTGHIVRESAGGDALRELKYCMAFATSYVEGAVRRGMDVDSFARRIGFYMSGGLPLLHEVAKFRAARRIWAKIMRDRFEARDPDSWKFRTHVQTSAYTTTAREPHNNIIRGTIGALAGILGGGQSVNVTPWDEAFCPPGEDAIRTALRTNQILYYETDVADFIDPLAGSYVVERLTDELEEATWEFLEELREDGGGWVMEGLINGIEDGRFVEEIARAGHERQTAIDSGELVIVGVNKHVSDRQPPVDVFWVDQELEDKQIDRLQRVREQREDQQVRSTLDALREGAAADKNLIDLMIPAAKARATLGEMVEVLVEVLGSYEPYIATGA